jgi:hypothetical protein
MKLTNAALLVAVLMVPLSARAQDGSPEGSVIYLTTAPAPAMLGSSQPEGPRPTPEHTGIRAMFVDLADDLKHLPSQPNYWLLAIGGGTALAVHPADTHATPYLVDASWSHNVFSVGAVLGDTPTLAGMSLGTYAIGRIGGSKKVSHVGMDMLEALMVNEMIVETLKYTTRRERPDGSGATSFPSGHASNTFAMATALERHAGWKYSIPAYAVASYVAASRLHDNRHYLSDVVFGAAVGIVAGRTVTRAGHQLPVTLAAVPGGAAVMYVHQSSK